MLSGFEVRRRHLGACLRNSIAPNTEKLIKMKSDTNSKAEGCSWFKVAYPRHNTNGIF